MEPFYFHPTLLLRTPYFAYSKHKSLSLQDSMDLQPVRNAQLLAAPAFYDILKKNGFKATALNPKQKQTIANYLNRMHYRCTPFGLFAGTAPIFWADNTSDKIVLDASRVAQTLPGFSTEIKVLEPLKKDFIAASGIHCFSNPASILVGNDMRYLASSNEAVKENIKEYQLKSITIDKSIKQLLAFCRKPLHATAVIEYLMQYFEMDQEESTSFFNTLLDEQILLSNIEPNITGTPYSKRVAGMFEKPESNVPLLTQELSTECNAEAPLAEIYEKPFDEQAKSNCYAHVSMRASGYQNTINRQHQQKISDGLYAIHKMLPASELQDLEAFKFAFLDKFDQRCIPLLEALDPELGVDYAGLSNAREPNEILEKLQERSVPSQQKDIKWSAAHTMLLRKWQSSKANKDPICLDDIELDKLPSSGQPLPSSISTIFKVHNDTVFLEHIGGATSNAILGRFSIFHKEIESCCKEVSAAEMALNPEVLFAEITSIQDIHAANIEKRKSFYPYEIPILTTSLLPHENQVQLNDLHVMVRHNRIVLFSAKHGKEVIPKLSTAFNYRRSTLSIYRFLCDLQFQGIQKITPFQMERFFPDLSFYPRVTYRNTMLQLAIWHIRKEEIQHILDEKDIEQKAKRLSDYLNSLNLPAVFALKEHDNSLVFKLNDVNDLLLFADNIKNLDIITLEEFPFIEDKPSVVDENGAAFQHQFVATLINGSTVYEGSKAVIQQALAMQRKGSVCFMPGSNWVYLKIYCHPSFGDTLLLKKIKSLIKQIRGQGEVEKWFFVRYNDPAFHIRVRLYIPAALQGYALGLLNQSLKKELHLGLISNIQLDTYKPEWERYGHDLLSATEDCFHHGSEWILHLLQQQHNRSVDNTEIAMRNIHTIFNMANMTMAERKDLLQKMYHSLQKEHGLDKNDQIELGIKFRNYRERMSLWLHHNNKKQKALSGFEKSLRQGFQQMDGQALSLKYAWISDLIHMQLNRAFSDQARRKEMVVYYLMSKWYLSEEKKQVKVQEGMMELV